MNPQEALANTTKKFAEESDSDIFLLNSGMMPGVDQLVLKAVTGRQRRKNVHLILVTEGGDANVAYRIARCFQRYYEEFHIVVSGWCKSAGTLICIGGNSLIFGDRGELGPLDVQLAKPDDLGSGRSSGLAIESAFISLQATGSHLFQKFMMDLVVKTSGRITTKTAAELAMSLAKGFLTPIFEQMDPLKIGEDYRSTQIAEQYAERLNAKAGNLYITKDFNAATAIVRGYPSHGFVIDKEEAESLFHEVTDLGGNLKQIATLLGSSALVPKSVARDERPEIRFLNEQTDRKNEQEPATVEAPKESVKKGRPKAKRKAKAVAA